MVWFDRDLWQAFVNTVMDLQLVKCGEFVGNLSKYYVLKQNSAAWD